MTPTSVCRSGWVVFAVALLWAGALSAQQRDAQLQADIDALLTEIEATPSTEVDQSTATARANVIWRWANDRAVQGGFIPLNTTLMVGRVRNPPPGGRPGRRFLEQLDDDARRLRTLDEGGLGKLTISGPPASPAGSLQTFEVSYTIGEEPLRVGGQVLIARHFIATAILQTEDPEGEGYVSIRTTREGARFERSAAPIMGPHGGFRAPVDLPAYRLAGTDLEKGDVVTLTYGDTSGGGPGMRVASFSNDAIPLPVYVDHGDGLFHEFPTPTYRVVGARAARVQGFAPSVVAVGEEVTVSVRTEDLGYSRASGPIPAYSVTLNGERHSRIAAAESTLTDDYAGAIHPLEVTFDEPGVYRFAFASEDGSVSGVANPILVEESPADRLYWGETHGHCGFAEGVGSVDGYFRFGRDDARLDYLGLSEHDIWMDDGEWQILNDAAQRWSQDGELIVYPGYEWTASRGLGGHHNVFYRTTGEPRVPTQEAPVLAALYRGLHARFEERNVLVIPHAHQAGDWRLSDLGTERLIEIMSGHGTFEWFGRYYLERGWQVGFVGASDDHLGHPGYSPGRGIHLSGTAQRSNIHQFGGLGGVWAPEKNRDALFDRLRARRTVATTGSERIIVRAALNDAPIGTALPMTDRRELVVRAIGTAPIAEIVVQRGNGGLDGSEVENVYVRDLLAESASAAAESSADSDEATSTSPPDKVHLVFFSDSEPRLRDNPRGHRPWTGSVRGSGVRITGARWVGRIGPDTDQIELTEIDGASRLRFDVATRGIDRVIELDLEPASENGDAAASLHVTLQPNREGGRAPRVARPNDVFPAAQLHYELAELAATGAIAHDVAGGIATDRVTLRRADMPPPDDVEFTWVDERNVPGGDWYVVRVTQVDGAVAWTSPWWVGREPVR